MNTGKEFSITVKEKILLHLLNYSKYSDELEVPPEVTQQGIAQSINALRPHVSLALKDFNNQNFVSERKANIQKGKRKQKVYFLKPEGMTNALGLRARVENFKVSVRDRAGVEKEKRIGDISKSSKVSLLTVINSISEDGMVDLGSLGQRPQPRAVKPQPQVVKPAPPQPAPIPRARPAQPQPVTPAGVRPHVPPAQAQYPSQYPYPYYYPPQPGYYPQQEMPEWQKERIIKSNKIIFGAGYFLLVLGAVLGLLSFPFENFLFFLAGLIFIIIGIVILPVAIFEVRWVEDLKRYMMTLVILTIFTIIIFYYFAILEIDSDAETFIFRYEIITWFVIISTFFGVLGFGKFIPQPVRATLGRSIGVALVIYSPFGAIIGQINIFTSLFWLIIAIAAFFVGHELDENAVRSESIHDSIKTMHTSIAMGAGLGIIFCGVGLLLDGGELNVFHYTVIILWFMVAARFISITILKNSDKIMEGLVAAVPIFISVLLLFFGVFLVMIDKSMEAMIEVLLALVIGGYAAKRLLGIDLDKHTVSLILLLLVAETASLVVFLI